MDTNAMESRIEAAGVTLDADIALPAEPIGVVLFAHGSGSSRHSPRNRAVAAGLNRARLATVLVDLLTAEEERTQDLRFDIDLLGDRLVAIIDWLGDHAGTARLPVGLFGASTGAAAALVAAAERPNPVRAVVSRGGRPDLAGQALARVQAPTLLIVGGSDSQVRELNEQARTTMTTAVELRIIPEATHLFEEPGALEQVTAEAGRWFTDHLAAQ